VSGVIRLALVLAVAVAGCSALVPRQPLLDLPADAIEIATYDFDPGPGPGVLCTLGRAVDPVVGTLAGDPDRAPHAVWLVAADGREVPVLWPRGFSARFTDGVELFDRFNVVVAGEGDTIDLNLGWSDAAGTLEDPYEAWWINDDCYPPIH
jgi:hypothetical protein